MGNGGASAADQFPETSAAHSTALQQPTQFMRTGQKRKQKKTNKQLYNATFLCRMHCVQFSLCMSMYMPSEPTCTNLAV